MRNSNSNTLPFREKSASFGSIFDSPKLQGQLAETEKQVADPNFWSDSEKSQKVMRERKRLEDALATDRDLARRTGDISTYFELAREGENVEEDLKRELDSLHASVERLETETLLSGEQRRAATPL